MLKSGLEGRGVVHFPKVFTACSILLVICLAFIDDSITLSSILITVKLALRNDERKGWYDKEIEYF